MSPVKHLRLLRGMKRRELAEKVDMSVGRLTAIESGKHTASIRTLARLARVLDVPLQVII